VNNWVFRKATESFGTLFGTTSNGILVLSYVFGKSYIPPIFWLHVPYFIVIVREYDFSHKWIYSVELSLFSNYNRCSKMIFFFREMNNEKDSFFYKRFP
jgi:hypothetical protein